MVYHFSSFICVHKINTLSLEENMATNKAYEPQASSNSVKVIRYHAENGRYDR